MKLTFALLYKQVWAQLYTILGGFMLIAGIVMMITPSGTFGKSANTNSSDPIAWGIIFLLFYPIRTYVLATKRVKSSRIQEETRKYTFSDVQFKVESVGYNASIAWTAISKVIELKDFIVMYDGKAVVSWVPKRAFSVDALVRFRNMIKSIPTLTFGKRTIKLPPPRVG